MVIKGDKQEIFDPENEDFLSHQKRVRKQKIIIAVFSIAILGIVVLFFYKMNSAFQVPLSDFWQTGERKVTLPEAKIESVYDKTPEELKQLDTDEDGLSDFDEVYVYKTSAYLQDSDSDGVSDFEEIYNGEDPNCPLGQVCFVGVDKYASNNSSDNSDIDTNTKNSFLYQLSSTQIRALLVQGGAMSESEIDLFSDEEIMDIYYKFLEDNPAVIADAEAAYAKEQGIDYEPSAQVTGADQKQVVTNLKAQTPEAVRQMLMTQGFSEEEVYAISDEDLMKLYQIAINRVDQGEITNAEKQILSEFNISIQDEIDKNVADQSLDSQATMDQLQDLAPSQIRQVLVDQGVEQSIVDEMTDDQLIELYQSALKQMETDDQSALNTDGTDDQSALNTNGNNDNVEGGTSQNSGASMSEPLIEN